MVFDLYSYMETCGLKTRVGRYWERRATSRTSHLMRDPAMQIRNKNSEL